jgi:predicted O-methyltransferase YrrM
MRRETDGNQEALGYIASTFAHEDEYSLRAKRAAHEMGVAGMMVSPVEGKILYTLLRLHKARTVVEVGGLTGYSALWMARALPEDGQLFSLEMNAQRASVAEQNFESAGIGRKIRVIVGDAQQNLPSIERHGPFDAIFIDANKSAYPDYLRWAEDHVRVGGLIIGDNTLLWGQVWKDSPDDGTSWAMLNGMKEFNARVADSSRYESVLLPTIEGMTVAIKKF